MTWESACSQNAVVKVQSPFSSVPWTPSPVGSALSSRVLWWRPGVGALERQQGDGHKGRTHSPPPTRPAQRCLPLALASGRSPHGLSKLCALTHQAPPPLTRLLAALTLPLPSTSPGTLVPICPDQVFPKPPHFQTHPPSAASLLQSGHLGRPCPGSKARERPGHAALSWLPALQLNVLRLPWACVLSFTTPWSPDSGCTLGGALLGGL